MYKKFFLFCFVAFIVAESVFSQVKQENVVPKDSSATDTSSVPVVSYTLNNNKKYEIAGIKVKGAENYEDFVIINFSGLAVGDKISVPGEEITNAVKRFWRHGLFSDVKIFANKMTNDKVWLTIELTTRPIIEEIRFSGVKKGERTDLEKKIGVAKGAQITPDLMNRAKIEIKKYYDEKGFSNAQINVGRKDDPLDKHKVVLLIDVNKNQKTHIENIFITGNQHLSDYTLKTAMKKTNEGFSLRKHFMLSWRKLFSTKKFVEDEYKKDLDNIVQKYNEYGYRDAGIVSDSVVKYNDKKVNIYIHVNEGDKYYIRNIKWIGNTKYPADILGNILNMKKGDVYNQKKLDQRLTKDDDAVANAYYNNGYIFSYIVPVETYVGKDSVDLEMRVTEGAQATINRVLITGNDRVYEDVIRRELFTKPGQLFSKDAIMRSARQLAQMGHFDPEHMDIKPIPNAETGTVDISYGLTSKANDQVELSAGYGQTGVIGKLSLKFTNFSIKNLFNPKTYKGIIPQGEGQTLTLSGQTNGRYYQSYSISFLDPWFGGKRPNSLSVTAYYMAQTGMSSRYYSNYNSPYSYYNSYYSGYYGTSSYLYDTSKSLRIAGLSLGYGKRLKWPDDYFQLNGAVEFSKYMLKNWGYYFPISNGNCNSLTFNLTLQRNSTDNPLYTRSGSMFSLSVTATPPYSLWDGKNYASMSNSDGNKFKWIEYHKWALKSRIFMPLANPQTVKRTPVLMSRVEYGFLGSYNKNKQSPFETYYMGGSGMTGYTTSYAQETIGLRGYADGSLTPYGNEGYAYSRLTLEFRYPLVLEPTSTIYGLSFIEAGNSWHSIQSFNPFDLKRSAGVGVRIYLPMIGLMGLDWGYGFDSPTPGAKISGSQLHFIIGQEF